MTLIAAVPCGRAFAIAADSQETDGDYRGAVQKISPVDFGGIKAIVAGSGNGDLIDSFIEKLSRRFQGQAVENLSDFVLAFEDELGKFVTLDVALCAGDKSLTLFVGASNAAKKECGVWVSRNVTLVPLKEPLLIGWEEKLYKSIIRRYCYQGMTPPQAILACIYTLIVAEETSQYVKGPFSVAVVHPGGIYMEPPEDVEQMAQRLKEYEEQIKSVFLQCSDLGTSSLKLTNKLEDFSRAVVAMHEAHAEAEIHRLFTAGFDSRTWPYSKIPRGVQITFTNTGAVEVTHMKVEGVEYFLKWDQMDSPPDLADLVKTNQYKVIDEDNLPPALVDLLKTKKPEGDPSGGIK